MRRSPDPDLALVAAFSAVLLIVMIGFAAFDPAQRTLGSLLLGLIALAGLGVSLFAIFLRGVDERLFRVSEYRRRQGETTQQHSTLWSNSTTTG